MTWKSCATDEPRPWKDGHRTGGGGGPVSLVTAARPYIRFTRHGPDDLIGDGADGVVVEEVDGERRLLLSPLPRLTNGRATTDAGERPCWSGRVDSPVVETDQPFDAAIPSWSALTPPGTWLQVDLRVRLPDGRWTPYYTMAVWAADSGTVRRHSVSGQDDADARVATDTLELRGERTGRAVQYRLTLFTTVGSTPSVRSVSVVTSDSQRGRKGRLAPPSDRICWGRELPVPQRSQRIGTDEVNGWCSPTATAMVLAYWGHSVSVAAAAEATYDHTYGGTGNWAFNTAWAATYGLEGFVTRLGSLVDVEAWIGADAPVIISLAFGREELPGTPIESSHGHLIVVRGFTGSGDVIVNDPAGRSDSDVRRVYDRVSLEQLWLRSSTGTAYLIHPPGHAIPDSGSGSW